MGLSEEIRQQLITSFKTEQAEHVQKINQGLLVLEKNPAGQERQTLLDEIFREAHSLKGAARSVGMTTIEGLGHHLEDVLLLAKEGRLTFSPELFDLLYQALDAVEMLIERVEAGDTAPPTGVLTLLAQLEEIAAQSKTEPEGQNAGRQLDVADEASTEPNPLEAAGQVAKEQASRETAGELPATTEAEPGAAPIPNPQSKISQIPERGQNPKSDETIRVSVNKLDALMAQFSELLGAKIRAEQRLAEVRQLQSSLSEWQKEWLALRSTYSRLIRNGHKGYGKELAALLDFAGDNQERLRAFNTTANTLYRQLSNDTMRLSLIIDELQEEIKRVRMLPLTTITATFGRMVRDLAREQGKQIGLTITGDETELDKRVLEQIKDPLIHLLRNAVDHGLEPPAEREQAGKPAEGRIILAAGQQGNNVAITVSDDGRGLDLEAIRRAAARKGVIPLADAEKLGEAEAANLIFNTGLSTSKIITDISGRGVGLDVVRKNVEELHGTLEVNSEPGQGTVFTMTLPLTLASSRGLLVRAGEQIFAIPHSTVERMLHVAPGDVTRVEGKEAITYQGRPVALARLADLLGLAHRPLEGNLLTVVIVGVAEKRLGLIVDDLVGEQEIVMKSLGQQLARVGGIAGATVLGSGQVVLVLHVADLVKLAARAQPGLKNMLESSQRNGVERRKTVLVVDDSITTRTLEKNILEAAGYEVKLATDGEEALAHLVANGLPHLIVSDINMPRLDGFALTHRIKQDDRYANIPVILVTSLDSPADKARGIEVGADAYIVKSSFDQANLLETIEQLV